MEIEVVIGKYYQKNSDICDGNIDVLNHSYYSTHAHLHARNGSVMITLTPVTRGIVELQGVGGFVIEVESLEEEFTEITDTECLEALNELNCSQMKLLINAIIRDPTQFDANIKFQDQEFFDESDEQNETFPSVKSFDLNRFH